MTLKESGINAPKINTNSDSINNHPICCRQTRKGILALRVINISSTTKAIRQGELAKIGAAKKLNNQISFTLGSSLCSHVIGFSRYNPSGRLRSKSMFGG